MIPRLLLLVGATIAVALALLAFRPQATPGPFMRDFEAYYSGASTWTNGRDPYSQDVWRVERFVPGVDRSHDEILPFVGPPYALPFFAALSRLSYLDAARVWTAVLALALGGVIALALVIARTQIDVFTYVSAAALAVGYAPITSDLALGQVALLAYAGALFAIASIEARFLFPIAGAMLSAAQPNVALALAVLAGSKRGLAVLIVAGLAAAGAFLAAGSTIASSYPGMLAAHAAAEAFLVIQHTPASVAFGYGLPETIARAFGIASLVLAVAIALLVLPRLRSVAQRFVFACTLLPFASSFFHEHDLLVAYAAVVWCARWSRGTQRNLALFASVLVAVDWLGLAQRSDGIAQSTLLAFAMVCGFVSLGVERNLPLRGAGAALAGFVAGAAIASMHPAPIWPDALGAFQANPTAPMAEVWHQEQARSGLAAANLPWAILRTFALIGSGLLAFTTASSDIDVHHVVER